MEQGLAKGMEQGRAEGETEKAIQIARTLKSMGLSTQDIAQATGLTEQEIEGL